MIQIVICPWSILDVLYDLCPRQIPVLCDLHGL